ncbi:MAG TPA: M81 family metallopeptidase [Rhodanobacteraceae bacterium]|nr:M81 family metallopeptidase [Rhodanobacteraceae bacterium]
MRIFAAGLITETNTFSPWPTGRRAFEENGLSRHDAAHPTPADAETSMVAQLWRDLAARDSHPFVESIFAVAQPAGPTLQSAYEELRDRILTDLSSQGPFDVVLLFLHGAMVAGECDDCEGDLIGRARDIVGSRASIGVMLDPHCHLTRCMVESATAIVLAKEYPHVDYMERGRELYDICVGSAQGRHRPVSAVFDCRMIGWYPTTLEPMRSLVARMREMEGREGVLSVSFAHGFPWGDTPETGSKVLAITEGDAELAARVAEEVGREIYDAREALLPRFPDIETALDQATQASGCVVLADTADNTGGGAPGDNVALLTAMLKRRIRNAAFGAIWDPVVAQVCADAGVGATLSLRLGGKCGPASGEAVDVIATVKSIRQRHDQAGLGPTRVAMRLSVWLEIEGIDVVICSLRTQVFSPDAFTGLGIDLQPKKLIAVKSSWHFQAGFAPIAALLIPVATPGAIQMDFSRIAYRKKLDMDFFPRCADPLGLAIRSET